MVCQAGVPYATSYWQVGDSAEQNGMFKMKLGEAKRKLVSLNSKAIAEQGWYPPNRNLLLHKDIRKT